MTELSRLLERMTLEPAFGPSFYRALMEEPVYALLPSGEIFTPQGTVRFIMWMREDGQRVIPFFSSELLIAQALTPETQGICLQGRNFLEACRGATVVLDPNQRYYFRLTAPELSLLLDTGSPNQAQPYVPEQPLRIGFRTPPAPASFCASLVLLFSQLPEVEQAYFAELWSEDEVAAFLVAVVVSSADEPGRVASQLSALLADQPPPFHLDLMELRADEETTADFEANMAPFYDRALGSRVLMDTAGSLQ